MRYAEAAEMVVLVMHNTVTKAAKYCLYLQAFGTAFSTKTCPSRSDHLTTISEHAGLRFDRYRDMPMNAEHVFRGPRAWLVYSSVIDWFKS